MYNEKVIDHFKNPRNFGKMENPDGDGVAGNLVCGDMMELFIKVGKNKKKEKIIEDIKFLAYGCAAAIASSSMVTEIIKGKTIEEAIDLSNKEVVDSLGGLPPIKIHCSVLAADALNEALYDYFTKNKLEIPEKVQKAHERISKSKEIIEERFKGRI